MRRSPSCSVGASPAAFPPDVYDKLRQSPPLIAELARDLLARSFSETLHEDIAAAVGLDLAVAAEAGFRDPKFRSDVLTAYGFCCAVCGFDVRLGNTHVGLEAAHIKWHQAGGPDDVPNGLALCALHHKPFDRGAFTVFEDLTLRLAESLHGSAGFEQYLLFYHGQKIRRPPNPNYLPAKTHLKWHEREVFHGPARFLE